LSLHIPLALTGSALYPVVFVAAAAAAASVEDNDDHKNKCEI
jgi:hypothetical protein